jgi:hypothetical protein
MVAQAAQRTAPVRQARRINRELAGRKLVKTGPFR